MILLAQQVKAQTSFKVIGYVPNWGNWPGIASSLQWDKLTHVHIAFYNPPSTASSVITGNAGLTSFVSSAQTNNVKVLASLGGANGDANVWNFWTSTAANRTTFVNNIVSFTTAYNLDGIDVDMEGGTVNANYQAFVVELGTALHGAGKLMSCAIAPWFGNNITPTALAQYDYIGLMSYDATGSWAPCSPGQHAPFSVVLSDIAYWSNKGVPKDKMVIGVPFYGYYFGSAVGSVTYNGIVGGRPGAEMLDMVANTATSAIYYNGIPTIKLKTRYALDGNYGGIMIWELSQDIAGPKSLLTAIDDVVQGHATATAPTIGLSSPVDLSTSNEGQIFSIDASITATVPVLRVEFFAGTTKIGEDFTSPFSLTWTPDKGSQAITAAVVDNLGGSDTCAAVTVNYNGITSTPYLGTAAAIPGTIEAENFDLGGQGVGYNEGTVANQGRQYRPTAVDMEFCGENGYNVGWTTAGEWMAYTVNVATAGTYNIILRVATPQSTRTISIDMDGTSITGTLTAPVSSGWGCYQNLLVSGVDLTAGQKLMKINFISGGVNINNVKFNLVTPVIGQTYEAMDAYVYPNPSAAPSIHTSDISGEQVYVQVVDASGRVLMEYTTTATSEDIQLPANDLEKGLYFIRMISGNKAATMTWVK